MVLRGCLQGFRCLRYSFSGVLKIMEFVLLPDQVKGFIAHSGCTLPDLLIVALLTFLGHQLTQSPLSMPSRLLQKGSSSRGSQRRDSCRSGWNICGEQLQGWNLRRLS